MPLLSCAIADPSCAGCTAEHVSVLVQVLSHCLFLLSRGTKASVVWGVLAVSLMRG